MTQEEFIEKSEEEVRFLNGGDESAREAYRQGYIDGVEAMLSAMEYEETWEFVNEVGKLNPFKD